MKGNHVRKLEDPWQIFRIMGEFVEGFDELSDVTNAVSIFGSALRTDFRPDSDVDVLVTFAAEASWSLLDHVAMEEDLSNVLGRKADIVTRRAVERSDNWIRRNEILAGAEPVYAAR